MSELIFLLVGLVAGAVGLFVWARYNKNKAIGLLNMDFDAKVDELIKYIDDEVLGDLDEKAIEKFNELKELIEKLKNRE